MRISRHPRRFQKPTGINFRVNEGINIPEIQVIDETGKFLGRMPTRQALDMAEERGYDLVEVNPTGNPPVAKLLNFGQFKYEKEKELKKQKLAVKQIEIKGIRLSTRIGAHDLELRKKQSLQFLTDGNKVKIEIILKGRERQHSYLAFKTINDFIIQLKQTMEIKIEQPTIAQGNKIGALIGKA